MPEFSDIITFKNYVKNGVLKKLPYDHVGVIPNYKYEIGDNNLFEKNNKNALNGEYYLIELKI